MKTNTEEVLEGVLSQLSAIEDGLQKLADNLGAFTDEQLRQLP